ncbi:hypothetical protein OG871_34845 [Kitasatospora sp. NBC_00374]|uniref:hypothetical protein n=1 Tax=Kitasatospora sp. NBC_00374 TaxID=2975964 RepID=UPI0030E49CAA
MVSHHRRGEVIAIAGLFLAAAAIVVPLVVGGGDDKGGGGGGASGSPTNVATPESSPTVTDDVPASPAENSPAAASPEVAETYLSDLEPKSSAYGI